MEDKTNSNEIENMSKTRRIVLDIIEKYQHETEEEGKVVLKKIEDKENPVAELLQDRKEQIAEKERLKKEQIEAEQSKIEKEQDEIRAKVAEIVEKYSVNND